MKIKRLKLRGAIGLRSYGEEIELNFEQFDQGALAIVGENGAGKSTILENLHPWPTLISRNGSLTHHFELRDSLKELEFEHGGHNYLSKVLIDGKNGKMEAYLYREKQPINDGGLRQFEPLNDGKIPSYKKEVDRLFGPPEIFFKSVFAGQNGEKISALTPGTKKEFFIGLMGLDRYEKLSAKAGDKAKDAAVFLAEIGGKRTQLGAQIEADIPKIAERPDVELQITYLSENIAALESSLSVAQKEIREADLEKERRRQDDEKLSSLEKTLREHKDEIDKLKSQSNEAVQNLSAQINGIKTEAEKIQRLLAEADAIRVKESRQRELSDNLARLDELKDKFNQLISRKTVLESQIKTAQAAKEQKISALEKKSSELKSVIERRRQQIESDIRITKSKIEDRGKSAGLLSEVPCHDHKDLVSACPLIGSARKASDELPTLEKALSDLEGHLQHRIPQEDELEALQSQIERLKADNSPQPEALEISGVDARIVELNYDAGGHQKARSEYNQLKNLKLDDKVRDLDRAELTLDGYNRRAEDLRAEINSASRDYEGRVDTLQIKAGALKDDIEALQNKIESYPDLGFESKTVKAAAIEKELAATRMLLGGNQAKLAEVDRLITTDKKNRHRLEELTAQEEKLNRDLSDWQLLERAFGKNGLQALELDAAGPQISSLATEMLQEFGREWAIRLNTIRPSADNKKDVETFEIIVSTPEGTKNFDDLSGGEKVWVEESLRKAVTIYLIKNSGRDYRTLFQDEADGPLDPERAIAFLDTTLKAHQLTGAHHTIIISQRPEIWQRIGQRIHLHPEQHQIDIIQEG